MNTSTFEPTMSEILASAVYVSHFLLFVTGILQCMYFQDQLVAAHTESPLIKFLPGFQEPLPFRFRTGYVGVDESEDVQLFYYFVQSEGNPKQDPLILPSLLLLMEQVHCILRNRRCTMVLCLPWFQIPTHGQRTSKASSSTDSQACAQAVQFLRKWLLSHPEFLSNPFYVAGDSYAGIFVPIVTQMISNENEAAFEPSINLKGYLAGNPITSFADSNFSILFSHGMGIISDELYESLRRSCGLHHLESDSDSAECSQSLEAYEQCTSGLNQWHILEKNCDRHTTQLRRSLSDEKSAAIDRPGDLSLSALECPVNTLWLFGYWFNDESVQEALHIRKGTIGTWVRCDRDNLPYEIIIKDVKPYHANLSTKGYKSLIYSGDHDFKVPFQSTQAWIRNLNYSITDDWRPWIVDGQYADYTRSYSNKMTFATVKGGGHTAQEYRPAECYVMFERWISDKPL